MFTSNKDTKGHFTWQIHKIQKNCALLPYFFQLLAVSFMDSPSDTYMKRPLKTMKGELSTKLESLSIF